MPNKELRHHHLATSCPSCSFLVPVILSTAFTCHIEYCHGREALIYSALELVGGVAAAGVFKITHEAGRDSDISCNKNMYSVHLSCSQCDSEVQTLSIRLSMRCLSRTILTWMASSHVQVFNMGYCVHPILKCQMLPRCVAAACSLQVLTPAGRGCFARRQRHGSLRTPHRVSD